MRVFVEETGRRIAPFDDPIGETLVGNRPLVDWQAEAFREAGLERVDHKQTPCVVLPDTVFITGQMLKTFVDRAGGGDAVLVLKRSAFGSMTTPVQPDVVETGAGWRFEKIRMEGGAGAPPRDVVVDPEEKVIEFPVPKQYTGKDSVTWPMPTQMVMTLHHWVHILWASQMANGLELMNTPKWKLGLGVAGAILRARSLNRWRILGQMNTIGKKCDIHPTAIVEGCTLGDGVKVGPYARLLFSNLGEGANIMAGAQVEMCTLGREAVVSQQILVRLCVLYPESVASQYIMQQCVFGRQAVTTAGAWSLDLNFDNDIRVPLDGQLWTTGSRYLGAAFGHRCRIGAGFFMSPGRTVPNDYFLVRDPDKTLSKLPTDLEDAGPLIASEPVLRPIQS